MLKPGQKVVCIDASPMRNGCADIMPLRLISGAIYTIRSIQTEPHISGYGVRLEELLNPSVVWSDGDEKEWSYQPERFRPIAFEIENGEPDTCQPTDAYDEWMRELDKDVIQDEFGYEPGEFTIYATHWSSLYEEGLTPREAWQRALDGFANKRREDDAARVANYARINSEDEAEIAMSHVNGGFSVRLSDNDPFKPKSE